MERDDLISRAAAIAEIGKLIKEYRENEKDEMADGMIIARRYGRSGRCTNVYVPMNGTTVDGWWFCANGERRDIDA